MKVLKKDINITYLFFIAVLGIAGIGFYSFVVLRYMGLDFDFSFNLLDFIFHFSTSVFPAIMSFVIGFISYKISNYIFKAVKTALYKDVNNSERKSYKLLFILSQTLYFAAFFLILCGIIYLMKLLLIKMLDGFFDPHDFLKIAGFEFIIISLFALRLCFSRRNG